MAMNKQLTEHSVILSPCVRNCCLDQQDICMGCFRHLDEIIGWQERSTKDKLAIQARCQQRRLANENGSV